MNKSETGPIPLPNFFQRTGGSHEMWVVSQFKTNQCTDLPSSPFRVFQSHDVPILILRPDSRLGMQHLESEQWTAAIGSFEESLQLDPDFKVPWSKIVPLQSWQMFLWLVVPSCFQFPKSSTIRLFNIAMENPPIFKFGKPSISMGHLYHGRLLNNQRYTIISH